MVACGATGATEQPRIAVPMFEGNQTGFVVGDFDTRGRSLFSKVYRDFCVTAVAGLGTYAHLDWGGTQLFTPPKV